MEIGILIKNLIIIGLIGGAVAASQSAAFRPAVSSLYTQGVKSQGSYITKAQEWLAEHVYPKLGAGSGEVAKTQASLQEGILEQKNKVVEDSTNATKKIIAEKFLQFLGITPQELVTCPVPN